MAFPRSAPRATSTTISSTSRPALSSAIVVAGDRAVLPVHTAVHPNSVLAEAGFSDEAALVAAFRDPGPVADLDPAAEDLEGYLFPDTYHFPRGETPERIVRALVGRFREVTGTVHAREAARSGLGFRGSLILASLIEKETGLPDERARVSRVFHNRLERGMLLQCDPTVIYAMGGLKPGRQLWWSYP